MTREALKQVQPGLPASWYRDPAHYERELEVFWYARWICVARDEELIAPGDWKLVRVGSQSLVMVRDEVGAVRAFHNTCRHRGWVLCPGGDGRFARRRFCCPCRAWTSARGGRRVEPPRRMET